MATSQSFREPDQLRLERVEDPHALALAHTQCLIREVNEQIHELTGGWGTGGSRLFMCECGDSECSARISADSAAYEAVRRFPTRFVVAPGHVLAGLDRAVEEEKDGYVVVEKIGVGAVAAIHTDPRRVDLR